MDIWSKKLLIFILITILLLSILSGCTNNKYNQVEIKQNVILDLYDKKQDLKEIDLIFMSYKDYMTEEEVNIYNSILSEEKNKDIVDKSNFNLAFINAELRKQVVDTALSYLGTPYVWGGSSLNGFDCSGLVMYVYSDFDIYLSHYTGSQYNEGVKVSYEELIPGDAVFFGNNLHHVGIYIGNDEFIHAPRTGDVVKISCLSDRGDFVGGARYIY